MVRDIGRMTLGLLLMSLLYVKGFGTICSRKIEIKQCIFHIFYIIIISLMHGLKKNPKTGLNTKTAPQFSCELKKNKIFFLEYR